MKPLMKAAVATAVVAAVSVPVQAGGSAAPANARSMTVSYADLDLSGQAGVDALYSRLRTAADQVCGPKGDGRDLTRRFVWKQCYEAALDNAVRTVAHVGLSEVHLAQTGRRVGGEQRIAGTQ
jgi:UrcA family protein